MESAEFPFAALGTNPQSFVVKQERRANPVIDQLNKLLIDLSKLIEDEEYDHPTFNRAEHGVLYGMTSQIKMILANYK
jgi:hypothetical protein